MPTGSFPLPRLFASFRLPKNRASTQSRAVTVFSGRSPLTSVGSSKKVWRGGEGGNQARLVTSRSFHMKRHTQESKSQFIPLNKLKSSSRNTRKTPHSKTHINALADSIEAHGQIQNLVVATEVDAEG